MSASPATTLNDRVAEQIRQQIVRGEFQPGQRLSEVALSESLEISRNTLREVFRLLTKEGLLRHVPNRGVFVAIPSMASIMDIYRVRRIVECQALAQAIPQHPARQQMRDAVAEQRQLRDAGRWTEVGTANMRFHKGVVALADSERLDTLFSHILVELRLAFGMLSNAEFLHAPYIDMNAAILERFEAGDMAQAAAQMRDYLNHSERVVLSVYARRMSEAGMEL
ncbi:MAG: GntR family transcriptional regulator [Comamonas sp.]